MRTEFLLRIIGGFAFGTAAWYYGESLARDIPILQEEMKYVLAISCCGFGIGLLVTPYFTTRPFQAAMEMMRKLPTTDLVAAGIGLVVGLFVSALAAVPLVMLPSPVGQILPVLVGLFLARLGISTGLAKKKDLLGIFNQRKNMMISDTTTNQYHKVILDTSTIIDGRIADISQTGFIMGSMLIPRFVLHELQHIADSPDALRRNRGRRGLDMLNRLQKESLAPIEVLDTEEDGSMDVDAQLVKLAKQIKCAIITNDFNLNKVAALQGVQVLNINELANSVKPVVLPGEEMIVRIIQEGKELGQGVGYLDDGTMVVVEGGRKLLNAEVNITVSRVLQTVAGRMIFAHLRGD